MVVLSTEEKKEMCAVMAAELPGLRAMLSLSQAELGEMCGMSRVRVSQIETGAIRMTWSQFTSVLLICSVDRRVKEYICVNRLFSPRLLQFLQRKEENIPPDVNVDVRQELDMTYDEFLEFYRKREEQSR